VRYLPNTGLFLIENNSNHSKKEVFLNKKEGDFFKQTKMSFKKMESKRAEQVLSGWGLVPVGREKR
jgi:hypothetical protein